MTDDADVLVGLSEAELEALAEGMLAPAVQSQLDDLLSRNAAGELTREENAVLDLMLSRVDQLTLLKTRARYTLRQHAIAERE